LCGCLLCLCGLLASCGSPGQAGSAVQRFDVPVGSVTFHAEVRTVAVTPAVRATIRLVRDDGTDAGVAFGHDDADPAWTGVVPRDGADMEFNRLESEPGVPAPLNVVRIHVTASVASEDRVAYELRSEAICIR